MRNYMVANIYATLWFRKVFFDFFKKVYRNAALSSIFKRLNQIVSRISKQCFGLHDDIPWVSVIILF